MTGGFDDVCVFDVRRCTVVEKSWNWAAGGAVPRLCNWPISTISTLDDMMSVIREVVKMLRTFPGVIWSSSPGPSATNPISPPKNDPFEMPPDFKQCMWESRCISNPLFTDFEVVEVQRH
ncbi:hypothetical protein PM082_020295 [Marasmius tenuissimus]|nr:hypothetical protein PM082_020295 [Marasmius tenuissimus]